MKKPSRLDYAYSVGRVRALEKSLIPKAVFWEAAEEKDLSCVMRQFFDAGKFSEEMVEIRNPGDLDSFLEKEEKLLIIQIFEILLDKDILKIILRDTQPEEAFSLASNSGYSFIKDYFKHKIDLGNLKVLARIKYLGLSKDKLERLLMGGGFLDRGKLLNYFENSLPEIGENLRASPYKDVWNAGMDRLVEKETFVRMEREFEDFLMLFLRKAKQIVFGPEPVFAYAMAKRKEFDFVRFLGIGKFNQIPLEILRKRISETYV